MSRTRRAARHDFMENAEALVIIRALADGRDPARGAALARESVFHQPDVIRALHCAMEILMDVADKRPAAGGAWSPQEETRLIASFEKGVSLTHIAEAHGRTRGAIRSRLRKLGLIAYGGGAPAASQASSRALVARNRKPVDDVPF